MSTKQTDFSKPPEPEEARAVVSALGKRGAEIAENAEIAEEAKAMSAAYTPRPRAALAGIIPAGVNSIGGGDLTLPQELRNFNPGPRISQTTEGTYDQRQDLESQFEKWQAEERARQQAILDAEKDAYQWYIKCRYCNDHGIYLIKPVEVGQVLGMGDWYSRYKPTADAYWDRPPVCQWCLHKGQEVRLDIEVVDLWKRTFRPMARFIWKAAKDRERFAIEGNMRAVLLPYGACNTQVDDIERRRQLYKQWTIEREEKAKKEKLAHG